MKKFIPIIKKIFHPSPLKLGLGFTILFSLFSAHYYIYKEGGEGSSKGDPLVTFVRDLHLKSVDYKLRFRGDRPGHSEIALITVDNRAIEHLGRWPWSRDRIAKIIDDIFGYGAKAIAFDIVFSEEDRNEKLALLNTIKSQSFDDPKIYNTLENKIKEVDSDHRLKESIAKHSDHLVMGGFFNTVNYRLGGANQKCADLISKQNPFYEFLEFQELQIGVLDEVDTYIPESIIQFLEHNLTKIALQTRSKNKNLNSIDLNSLIQDKQYSYCARWLDPEDDKSIPDLKSLYSKKIAKQEDWKDKSFQDFISHLRNIPQNPIKNIKNLTLNIDRYNEETKHFGFFNAFPDEDGTLRQTALLARLGDLAVPSLALKTTMLVKNNGAFIKLTNNPVDPSKKMIEDLQFMDLESGEFKESVPLDQSGMLKINYAGPQKMFAHMSAAELFNGKESAIIEQRYQGNERKFTVNKSEWIKDKIFIFGVTAVGVFDLRVTPFEEIYPGAETHANIIDNILRNDFLYEKRGENSKMFLLILGLGLLLSIIIASYGALIGLLFSFATLFSVLYIDYQYFFKQGVITSIILPILLTTFLYFLLTIYKYFTEEKTKKELKGTFQKYVSPSVVNEILKDAKNIELGGKKVYMSVLFSDIRGFTTLSENLDPQKLSDFLNSYLTPMTELVFENRGTLDKYMGDAVMAFFGAPIQYKEHAFMACKCALEMMEKLKELQKQYIQDGLPAIDIGIGINSGEMSVGNMGSETIRSYTVMGDAVNLGSRLEAINKEYSTNIIISEFTYADVKDRVIAREIDRVQVKGKLKPVKIYELVGIKDQYQNQTMLEVIEHFQKGYQDYMAKQFSHAIEHFEKALAIKSDDGPSLLFLSRAKLYLERPPDENWDGVFIMKTK